MATREFSRQSRGPRQCRRTIESTWTDAPSSTVLTSECNIYPHQHGVSLTISRLDSHWSKNISWNSIYWRWLTQRDRTTCSIASCRKITLASLPCWKSRRTHGKESHQNKRQSHNRSSSALRTSIGIQSSAMSSSSRPWCLVTSWRRSSMMPATAFVPATKSTSTTCSCCCAATLIHCRTQESSSSSATVACPWTIPTSRSSATSHACRKSPIVKRPMNSPIPSSSHPPTAKISCPTPISHSTSKVLSTTFFTRSKAWYLWDCWDRSRRTGCARTKWSVAHIHEYPAITFHCSSRWSWCTWQAARRLRTGWSTEDSRAKANATSNESAARVYIILTTSW